MSTPYSGGCAYPSRFAPQVVTHRLRALAWDHLDPALPAFDRMPG